jgi:hypothetical protein
MNLTTKELEEELSRRREKHNIRVGGTVIALNFDEMEEVQKQIEKFLKPAPVTRDWKDYIKSFKEGAEKASKERVPYFPPPINVPNWPNYEPVYPSPGPFRKDGIWCKDEMGG